MFFHLYLSDLLSMKSIRNVQRKHLTETKLTPLCKLAKIYSEANQTHWFICKFEIQRKLIHKVSAFIALVCSETNTFLHLIQTSEVEKMKATHNIERLSSNWILLENINTCRLKTLRITHQVDTPKNFRHRISVATLIGAATTCSL